MCEFSRIPSIAKAWREVVCVKPTAVENIQQTVQIDNIQQTQSRCLEWLPQVLLSTVEESKETCQGRQDSCNVRSATLCHITKRSFVEEIKTEDRLSDAAVVETVVGSLWWWLREGQEWRRWWGVFFFLCKSFVFLVKRQQVSWERQRDKEIQCVWRERGREREKERGRGRRGDTKIQCGGKECALTCAVLILIFIIPGEILGFSAVFTVFRIKFCWHRCPLETFFQQLPVSLVTWANRKSESSLCTRLSS